MNENPTEATEQYELGLNYLSKGEDKKGVYWIAKASQQGYAKAQVKLGTCYFEGVGVPKNLKKSVYWSYQAAKQGNVDAQVTLGRSYVTGKGVKQDSEKAKFWLTKAAQQGNNEAQEVLKSLAGQVKAEQPKPELVEKGDDNLPMKENIINYDELMQRTKTVYEEGDFDAAINFINNFIDKNPNIPEGYLVRSELNTELEDNFQKALDDAEKAIKINPKNVAGYNNRGRIYVYLGEKEKAFNDFNKAIELDENCAEAYVNRGNMYLKMGKDQKAINDCTKAIELSSNSGEELFEAYYNRGLVYMNIGEFEKALDDYNKVIELVFCKIQMSK